MQSGRIEGGFVVISRGLLSSSTWQMSATERILAITLILESNYKDQKWFDRWQGREIIIKRGEFITSLKHLSTKANLSLKSTRTALANLIKSGFCENITADKPKRASGYTHLHLRKYEKYQDVTKYAGAQTASEGQARGKRGASEGHILNKDNKDNKEKKGEVLTPSFSDFSQKEKREKEDAVGIFIASWQQLHCKRWETPDEYLPTGFERRDMRNLISHNNLEAYIAYAYHFHHHNGVGIRPGEKAPTIDRFLNKEAPKYCSTLRKGTDEWTQAMRYAKEFLAETRSRR